MHWEVDPAALRALVHPRLTLDLYEGRAFVGLVPFTMEDIQLAHLPKWPGMTNFHETNVRTYVHKDGADPGVWFLSLDAASRLCVVGARLTYHLPYFFADMSIEEERERRTYRSERAWPGPAARLEASFTLGEELGAAKPGTLEDFLAERYILYSEKSSKLYRGRVHHTPYPLTRATLDRLDGNLVAAAGVTVEGPPVSVLASPGVDVDVFGIEEVSGS